jgi:hypothetical protein
MGIFNFFKKKKTAQTKKVFYDNGSIKEEFQVNEDGVNHGSNKLYYPNQQLQVQVNWTNGIQDDGEVISYHDNGGKARQVILLNNKFTGNFFEWYSNGKNKKQGHYLDEKQIILKEWNENGELIEKDGNFNTKSSFNESDNQEAIAESKSIFLRLRNSLEKSPNLNRIFGEFTFAIRDGYSVRKYMEEANLLSNFETKNALIEGFTSIKDSFNKMLEKYEDNEVRKDFNALNEAIDILNKEIKNNNNLFEQELENINSQFELILKSKSDEDYPPIFWYNIVKERAIHMERDINEKTLSEIQSEWIWMHADEYKNKYSSYSKNDIIDEMTLRIQRFGFIYKTMLNFEKKLNALAKENKISSNSYIDLFKLNMSSAYASLFGTINYALSSGMTNNDISKLYTDFVYDKVIIDGTNPFVNLGTTQEDARNIIKDNLNIDIDNIKTKQIKVHQKDSKEAEETTEKKHVNFDKEYNELDELILDEDFKDWHEDYMFLKLVYEKIKTAKIQNDIQLNSFIKERLKKLTTSELTSKMVNFRSLENIIGKELSGWGDTNNTRFEGYIDVEQYHTIVTRSYQIGTEVMIDFVTKGDG